MTLRNPNTNESVEDYDKLQTVEINANTTKINANTTKIGSSTIVGSILYRLGLIKDYVIEYGSNANGSWEKWASGKLVQWGTYSFTKPMNADWGGGSNQSYFEEPTKPFPLPFVGDLSKLVFNGEPIHVSGTTPTSHQFRNSLTLTTIPAVYIVRGGAPVTSSTAMRMVWSAIGRWK